MFSDQIKKVATEAELESSESFMVKRKELIGKELTKKEKKKLGLI